MEIKKDANDILSKIIKSIDDLPKDSATVRERMREIEIVTKGKLFDTIAIKDEVAFLKEKITPLMKYTKDVNIAKETFRLKTEQLGIALLKNNLEEIQRTKESIGDYLLRLPTTIKEVREKEAMIDNVLSKKFWESVQFSDAMAIQEHLVEIMGYVRSEPVPRIVLDIDDLVQKRKAIEYGCTPVRQEYVDVYREEVEKRVRQLALDNKAIKKLQTNQPLTEVDMNDLEMKLNSPELFVTEDVLKKIYNQQGTLVEFVKHIIGLYKLPSAEEKISEAFKTFLVANNYLSANQVNFLRTLQTVFSKRKHVEFDDLFESPFTNFGVEAPIPLFSEDQLREVVELCTTIEREVFKQ